MKAVIKDFDTRAGLRRTAKGGTVVVGGLSVNQRPGEAFNIVQYLSDNGLIRGGDIGRLRCGWRADVVGAVGGGDGNLFAVGLCGTRGRVK